ncbi:MAG: ribosome recycling factor [bacterium]
MLKEVVNDVKQQMEKTLLNTRNELGKVRTGQANLSLVDTIKVDYYGTMTPLKQMANIGIPEPRLITIQPWDKTQLGAIEKAILKVDIGITPNNDGNIIRLPIPPLTEERREEIIKMLHEMGEQRKVSIRNIRKEGIKTLKDAEHDGKISEDEKYNGDMDIQELTDKHIEEIDKLIESKEKEVREV